MRVEYLELGREKEGWRNEQGEKGSQGSLEDGESEWRKGDREELEKDLG